MSDDSSWIGNQVDVLNNLAQSLIPVERMVAGAAYVIGLTFAMKAILALKAHADNRSQMSSGGLKEPLLYFFAAAMLIYLPSGFEVLMNTTFGYSSVLAYAPINSNNTLIDNLFGAGSGLGQTLTIIIQTIGVIAFVRGWVLVARSANQGQSQGGIGKGITHVFGGILAMNIVGTLEIINNTLYGGF